MLNQAAWQVMRNKEEHSGLRMTFYRFSPPFLSETYENRKEKLHNTGSLRVKDNQTGYCRAANNSQSWDISQPKCFRV